MYENAALNWVIGVTRHACYPNLHAVEATTDIQHTRNLKYTVLSPIDAQVPGQAYIHFSSDVTQAISGEQKV